MKLVDEKKVPTRNFGGMLFYMPTLKADQRCLSLLAAGTSLSKPKGTVLNATRSQTKYVSESDTR